MARKSNEELQEIMKFENVSRIWSWSKWDTFFNSPYEYFLKYIKKIPEDRTDCIYVVTGGIAHDILEKFYQGKINYEDMLDQFQDGWTAAYEIGGMKFDRNDEERNKEIGNKYYFNLRHFFENHKKIPYKVMTEQFAKIKVGEHLFQGYIDLCFKDEENNYHIIDWKTSSQYKGKAIKEKCGQLVLYAMALIQQGIPMEKIKIAWNFLKYANVTVHLKNGTTKIRTIERMNLGDSLKSNAKTWLKSKGYSEKDIEDYIEDLVMTNDIRVLPEEIQELYEVNDCFVYIPLEQELIDYWCDIINKTIDQIEYCEKEYAENQSDKAFWDSEESIVAQSYYFATLCGYSPNLHLPYKEYLEKLEQQKNGDNMFTGVGSDTENANDIPNCDTEIGSSFKTNSNDLSWLNDI